LFRRVDHLVVRLAEDFSVEPVDVGDPFDDVAEELNAQGLFVLIRGDDLDDVSPHPHRTPDEFEIVPRVIDIQQFPEKVVPFQLLPFAHDNHLAGPLLGRADPVDAADRGDNNDVPVAAEESARRPEAQPVDLVVDRRVFGDVRVGGGDVGLGLVVVIVADEKLHPVARKEPLELAVELRGKRLVVRHHEDGLAGPGDDV